MHYLASEDQELGDEIAPSVLALLNKQLFFESLEAQIFPEGDSGARQCEHSFVRTTELLNSLGFSDDELQDIMIVFKSLGGFCDCEILLNVDNRDNSPRARYWKERAAELEGKK